MKLMNINFKIDEKLRLKFFNFLPITAGCLAFLIAVAVIFYGYYFVPKKEVQSYPELNELKGNNMKFDQLRGYFRNLALKKGAPYAYEVLKIADIPKGTDMHLMGHAVGEILYQQKGAGGMEYCTPDFRNACSHTIVVGLLLEKGEAALSEISDACRKAPGGSGAYLMCFHGLGHGVLSYTGYDFKKSLELCKKVGPEKNNFGEYGECVGGMIMEQISGGDHDKELWSKQRKVNLKENDRLFPCNSNLLTDQSAKTFCYIYITPNLFERTGEKGFPKPTNQEITDAFKYCEKIPAKEQNNISTCFGGFGKEFVVFAKERDIRNIDKMSDLELKKVYDWCMLSDDFRGQDSCLVGALASLYWGGENDPSVAIRFCSLQPDQQRGGCFMSLISQAKKYLKPPMNDFCALLPQEYIQKCIN